MHKILITCPHAGCRSTTKRDCDENARNAAFNLASQLTDFRMIVGNVFRADLDLNRDVSWNHPFRQLIRQEMASYKPDFLLDMHSFPRNSNYGATDVTVLDEKPRTDYGKSLVDHLKSTLPYKVGYFTGAGNSIMKESRENGIPALLIEFGEFLTNDEITQINSQIVSWLYV